MNIIEATRTILNGYPKIAEFSSGVSIDYTDNTSELYGLSSTGDTLLKEDMLGNQTRQHNFVLYAVNQSYTDYDRLANSTFLLELGYWLEQKELFSISNTIGDIKYTGEIVKISTANGMLFDLPTGNPKDGVTYQIQIQVKYKLKMEDY